MSYTDASIEWNVNRTLGRNHELAGAVIHSRRHQPCPIHQSKGVHCIRAFILLRTLKTEFQNTLRRFFKSDSSPMLTNLQDNCLVTEGAIPCRRIEKLALTTVKVSWIAHSGLTSWCRGWRARWLRRWLACGRRRRLTTRLARWLPGW